jgi:hypothetical protein
MTETPSAPPLTTFVVRFRREWWVAGGQCRGQIEHLQGDEGATFLTWHQMVALVECFGIVVEGGDWEPGTQHQPGVEDEKDCADRAQKPRTKRWTFPAIWAIITVSCDAVPSRAMARPMRTA